MTTKRRRGVCSRCGHRHYFTDVCGEKLPPKKGSLYSFENCDCPTKPFGAQKEKP